MKKEIKILGTGCSKCKKTLDIVTEIITENNIEATIEKIEDITEIIKHNVMSTPAVVVDGNIVIKGRIPTKTELIDILRTK
jgi:small redox-active disulfide protein 2